MANIARSGFCGAQKNRVSGRMKQRRKNNATNQHKKVD